MHRRLSLAIAFAVNVVTIATAQVNSLVINEVCASNIDQWVDPSFNYGGWVELYNPTSSAITLTGWYLSDNPLKLNKAKVNQETIIEPGRHVTLWFDHYSKWSTKTIDMKLDCDGGTLYVSDGSGNLVTSLSYPSAISRCSWARTTDGGETWSYCAQPTPGKSNDGSPMSNLRLEAPEVDSPSRIFSAGVEQVNVNIPEGCTLRYTTDGSAPSETNGYVSLTGNFTTTTTRTYRFRLFREGWLPSPVVSRTLIRSSLDIDLPILSIVSTHDNFYSDSLGIFCRGVNGRAGNGESVKCNWNMDWERPAVFEYFSPNGELRFAQETGVERCGGWSRAWKPYSFKIKGNKRYEGKKFLQYPFFSQKPYLRHQVLQIRNGGNDLYCRVLDAFSQQIIITSGIDIDCQEYQPVAHFVNGEWKGLLNMREPSQKHYVLANYGFDDDEIDQFEMSPDSGYCQKCGDYEAMQKLLDLSKNAADEETYDEICKLIDMDEYCNYMAAEFYMGNLDWPQNNLKGWRPRQENGKFRFVMYDLDGFGSTTSPFTTFANKQTYTFDRLYGEPVTHITKEIEMVTLFLNLLNNGTFRKKFIDTFCLVTYSVFEPTRCATLINELAKRVEHTMSLYNNESPWSKANDLKSVISTTRQTRLMTSLRNYSRMNLSSQTVRRCTLNSNIDAARLTFNGMPIPTNKFSGQYYAPLTVSAEAPRGYRFVGWKANGGMVETDREYTLPSSTDLTLQAVFEPVADDSLAKLPPVIINEVSANNGIYINDLKKKADWIELYNTTNEDIDLRGMLLTDNVDNVDKWSIGEGLDDESPISTIVPAHGYCIIWCDKEAGVSELHAPFKLRNENGAQVMLTAADGSWHDVLTYSAHGTAETVGRYPDASERVYQLTRPSIAKANLFNTLSIAYEQPVDAIRQISSDAVSDDSYHIYDMSGRIIGEGTGPIEQRLPAGVYVVQRGGTTVKMMVR